MKIWILRRWRSIVRWFRTPPGSIHFILVIITLLTFTVPESSGDGIGLSFSGGFSFPATPHEFRDYWKRGYCLDVGFVIPISPEITLRGLLEYSKFGMNSSRVIRDSGTEGYGVHLSGGAVYWYMYSLSPKISFPTKNRKVTPYLTCGVGLFTRKIEDCRIIVLGYDDTLNLEPADTDLIFPLGIGLDLRLNDTNTLFIELRHCFSLQEWNEGDTGYRSLKVGIIFEELF